MIRPEKQLEHFLDLAASLPGLRFALVGGFDINGSVDLRTSTEERLSNLRNVSFLGPQKAEDVIALLAHSKVLVNTSIAEGFPNSMLEAWSVGVPVVSLFIDPGGVIEREQIGLLSRTKCRLRDNVLALSLMRKRNEEAGRRGLAYVRREHSLEAICKALAQAFPDFWVEPEMVHS
jgi:glycosyltransferase involved in cell wall biosynthesis